MALLELDEFSLSSGDRALLNKVSLSLEAGSRLGIVGHSGAGKSMLALSLAGRLPDGFSATGMLQFQSQLVGPPAPNSGPDTRPRTGVIFQNNARALDPLMTVGAQLDQAMKLAKRGDDSAAAVGSLLADVGLAAETATAFPRDLRAREQQLAMVAMALAGLPDLLVADEPVVGLDLVDQRPVLDLLERISRERGMTLVLVTHDLRAVAKLCNQIAVLHGGRLVEAGVTAEVLERPSHDITRLLVAARRQRTRTLMNTPIAGELLAVRNVSRRFTRADGPFRRLPPVVALDGVSLSLRAGETLALVGPTGSGKSTLGRIVAGLERASTGTLEFARQTYHGPDLPRLLRRDISMVFADPATSFNPHLTVGESVAEPLRLETNLPVAALSQRIVDVVTAVGFDPEQLGRLPGSLLPGQLQRLAIARALVTRPRLVVLDEPLAHVDVITRGLLPVLLHRLRSDFGLTLLLITHDLELVRLLADRVMVMNRGGIVEAGTSRDVLTRPQHEVTRSLVEAMLPAADAKPPAPPAMTPPPPAQPEIEAAPE